MNARSFSSKLSFPPNPSSHIHDILCLIPFVLTRDASDLEKVTDDFPEEFFKSKVLPELVKSVEFGGGGPKALTVVLKIAAKLPSDDFDSKITPFIVRAFANPDRGIRVCLLDSLPLIIDQLSQKTVNDKIFPQLVGCLTFFAAGIGTLIRATGYWIYRCDARCSRTNAEICARCHWQTIRSHH